MRGIDYRTARQLLPLAEVLRLIEWQPCSRRGDGQRGPCPLHGSRSLTSRVFAVDLGKNLWHCFRCGAGGNALDLWATWSRQELYAAVLDLCRRLHQPVPWLPGRAPMTNQPMKEKPMPP
jgi:DNA primase